MMLGSPFPPAQAGHALPRRHAFGRPDPTLETGSPSAASALSQNGRASFTPGPELARHPLALTRPLHRSCERLLRLEISIVDGPDCAVLTVSKIL